MSKCHCGPHDEHLTCCPHHGCAPDGNHSVQCPRRVPSVPKSRLDSARERIAELEAALLDCRELALRSVPLPAPRLAARVAHAVAGVLG